MGDKETQPPHGGDQPKTPPTAEETFVRMGEALAAGFGGPIGGGGVALFELLRSIDWAAVAKAIEEGIRACKRDQAWVTLATLWEKVGQWKDIFLERALAPYTNDAQRADMRAQMMPKLEQIQSSMAGMRRAIEKGDEKDAKAALDNVHNLITQLQSWLAANPPVWK
jgi:hypothetical protein